MFQREILRHTCSNKSNMVRGEDGFLGWAQRNPKTATRLARFAQRNPKFTANRLAKYFPNMTKAELQEYVRLTRKEAAIRVSCASCYQKHEKFIRQQGQGCRQECPKCTDFCDAITKYSQVQLPQGNVTCGWCRQYPLLPYCKACLTNGDNAHVVLRRDPQRRRVYRR